MIHKLGRLAAALVLAATAAFTAAAPVAAHSTGSAHYNGQCSTSDAGSGYRNGIDWVRSSSQVGSLITGASSKITARALIPCLNGDATHVSFSFQAAANVQGTDIYGTYNFVQLGIAKFDDPGTYQCGSPDSGEHWISDQTTFVFTPGNNNGILCKATWFDLDNNGVGDDPIGGRTYKFTINQYNSGISDYWRFCITDLTAGAGDCIDRARTTHDSGIGGNSAAWWGCEVGNRANGMGVRSPDPNVSIFESAYEKANNPGVWNYTENSSIFAPWNPKPSYYVAETSQTGLGERVNCVTNSHS